MLLEIISIFDSSFIFCIYNFQFYVNLVKTPVLDFSLFSPCIHFGKTGSFLRDVSLILILISVHAFLMSSTFGLFWTAQKNPNSSLFH